MGCLPLKVKLMIYHLIKIKKGNESLAPGDIKYVDVNNDGTLDWRDQEVISTSNIPQLTFGLNMSIDYKGFDFILIITRSG